VDLGEITAIEQGYTNDEGRTLGLAYETLSGRLERNKIGRSTVQLTLTASIPNCSSKYA
jgi:hypothetical protein